MDVRKVKKLIELMALGELKSLVIKEGDEAIEIEMRDSSERGILEAEDERYDDIIDK